MKSIHKTKDQINLTNSNPLPHQGKRNYYFHPDEDFREDLDWKREDSETSKVPRSARKTKQSLNT